LAKFKIFETAQFTEDLSADFKGRGAKIRNKLLSYVYPQLRENPYFGKNIKKLKNYNYHEYTKIYFSHRWNAL